MPQPLYWTAACGLSWFVDPGVQELCSLIPALHRTMTPRESLLDSVHVCHSCSGCADEHRHVNEHTRATVA
jgi:hypothetical protein